VTVSLRIDGNRISRSRETHFFHMNSIQKERGRLQAGPVKGRPSRSRPGTQSGIAGSVAPMAAGADATLTSLGYFPPLSNIRQSTLASEPDLRASQRW